MRSYIPIYAVVSTNSGSKKQFYMLIVITLTFTPITYPEGEVRGQMLLDILNPYMMLSVCANTYHTELI